MESKNHLRGVQLFELGRFQEAISYLTDAVSEDVYNYPSKYYLALCFFNIEDYGKSSQMIDDLLRETPNEGNLFFLKAQIASRLDKLQEAIDLVDKSHTARSVSSRLFGFKGALLMDKKKFEEALHLSTKVYD